MTIEQFNNTPFTGGMTAKYQNRTWDIIACDFEEKELCLDADTDTVWVHCENVEIEK